MLLGQPLGKTMELLLTVEVVLLLLTSLVLDAGASMTAVAIAMTVCWIGIISWLFRYRIRPPWPQVVKIAVGITLPIVARLLLF